MAAKPEDTETKIALWPVDSMQKIFKDDISPESNAAAIVIQAARNETVSGQAVVRCRKQLTNLKCRASSLTSESGRKKIAAPLVRYVGFVPMPADPQQQYPGFSLRKRPCDYPDPLNDAPPETLAANTAQPLWLTIKVPADAPAGRYAGTIEIEAESDGATLKAKLPVKLELFVASLPDRRTLWVSNWAFGLQDLKALRFCGVTELFSAAHWKLLEVAARNMAAHRQNVILIPTYELIEVKPDASGGLAFDFGRFDKWIGLFRQAGVSGRIEGAHLAQGTWHTTDHKSSVWSVQDGKAVRKQIPSFGEEHKQFLRLFLPALQAHLEKQGWLASYVQHVFDEPYDRNDQEYKLLASAVREFAPKLKTIDASGTEALAGALDIWIPMIHEMAGKLPFYQERRAKGDEVWFYTCCQPVGEGALNRFIEFPLTRVRLLHWANFSMGATGYLHWGWNHWLDNKPGAGTYSWPPGDEWIVYPKEGGFLDSIRSEAMLEGIQDYELLALLAARDAKAANAICSKLVQTDKLKTEFDDKANSLRAARLELLKALSTPERK